MNICKAQLLHLLIILLLQSMWQRILFSSCAADNEVLSHGFVSVATELMVNLLLEDCRLNHVMNYGRIKDYFPSTKVIF